MLKTPTKFAKFPRPLSKGANEINAIKLGTHNLTVAEVRTKSNGIHIENIATKPLARKVNLDNITRHLDKVADFAAGQEFAGNRRVVHQYTGGQQPSVTQCSVFGSHRTHPAKNHHRYCFISAIYQ